MTQRYIKLAHPGLGRDVLLVVGFDRPLGHYFMVIQEIDDAPGRSEDESIIYSNLEDPGAGFPHSLNRYQQVLSELGITMPESVWNDVMVDKHTNAGNLQGWYDRAGNAIGPEKF